MLTLYSKSTCPFCRRVLAVIDNLDLEVEIKDIADDEAAAAELIEKGGQRQVPYLIDTDQEVAMYESDDIVAHLQQHYGTPTESERPRIHVGGSTCVSCEG
jgi:Glutaredoxin 2